MAMSHLFIKKINLFSANRQCHLHLVVEIRISSLFYRQNRTFISSKYQRWTPFFHVHPERRKRKCQSANTTAKATLTQRLTVPYPRLKMKRVLSGLSVPSFIFALPLLETLKKIYLPREPTAVLPYSKHIFP